MLIEYRSACIEDSLDPDLPPIIDRLLRHRGVTSKAEVSCTLSHLKHYKTLKGIEDAASLISDAILQSQTICIVGDFDADGATSTALCLLSLRDFAHHKAQYIVPNRFDFGYGLTKPVVDMALEQGAQLLITVDNGISSIEGVAHAKAMGLKVVVTDHHLAGSVLPEADAIVNPNQAACDFESKHLAGVGVAFYVMLAVKAKLHERDYFSQHNITEPNLAAYLDIVALGTVADVVPLDHNNRILVHQGLQRIRARQTRPGILALLDIASRNPARLSSSDLGFVLGPRLNAAGRLQDMSVGIECLLSESYEHAYQLAQQLDELNRQRRSIEQDMQALAEEALANISLNMNTQDEAHLPAGIVLYDADYHQGVVGIVAGRIKEKHYKPTIAFADEDERNIKGSARSVEGVHIRDVIERIHTQHEGLITKFGGHAMAAGLSLPKSHLATFKRAFEHECARAAAHLPKAQTLLSDGTLAVHQIDLNTAQLIKQSCVWGQQFEEPLFDDIFELIEQRIVGQKHLKLLVQKDTHFFDAIAFNVDLARWPNQSVKRAHLAYRLDINEYRGQVNVQLLVSDLEAT